MTLLTRRTLTAPVQPNGKQRISAITNPGGDTYTPSSGIWQTVWCALLPHLCLQCVYIACAHVRFSCERSVLRSILCLRPTGLTCLRLEAVPQTYIESLTILTDTRTLTVSAAVQPACA